MPTISRNGSTAGRRNRVRSTPLPVGMRNHSQPAGTDRTAAMSNSRRCLPRSRARPTSASRRADDRPRLGRISVPSASPYAPLTSVRHGEANGYLR